jgi:hypothetical protein
MDTLRYDMIRTIPRRVDQRIEWNPWLLYLLNESVCKINPLEGEHTSSSIASLLYLQD